MAAAHVDVLLERPDGILEHGEHETLLRLERGVDLQAVEELRGKDSLGRELGAGTGRFDHPCLTLHDDSLRRSV